jgi:hypothetical protein
MGSGEIRRSGSDENGPWLRDSDTEESSGGDAVKIMEQALLEGYTWSGEVVDGATPTVPWWLGTRLPQAGSRHVELAICGGVVLGPCG